MFNNCKFDERQLKIRGDIFKHGFIFVGILLILNAFLVDNRIILIEGMMSNIMIFMLPVTFCLIEMIMRDVYTTTNMRIEAIFYLFGLLSIVMLIMNIIDILSGKSLFIQNHLSDNGVHVLFNILIASIFITFIIKKAYNKSCENNE